MNPRIRNYIRVTFFLIGVFIQQSFAAEISGVVFRDANRNGERDPGERGVKGVMVSNQVDVVQTDRKGRYNLPVREEMVIFITKPVGYALPVNQKNLPRFYYIHQPGGSQDLKYRGVEPTGELPETVNFPLYKVREPKEFKVIVFSDPQPTDQQEINYIRDDVVAELVNTDAAFGIALGDIMNNDLSLFPEYNDVVSQIGIPFFNVPGNHDMNYDSPDDEYALETFKRHFGPPYYAFEYGQVHFIVLDNVKWINPSDKDGYYEGELGERQLTWLENHLREVPDNRLVVLNMHIPLVTHAGGEHNMNMNDGEQLFDILETRENILALAGHYHMLEHTFIDDRYNWNGEQLLPHITCSAVSGSWWEGPRDERGIPITDQRDGTPNGYHIFTFDGNDYNQRVKAAKFGENFQMRISAPKESIAKAALNETDVIVNVFNANERWKSSCRIDDSQYWLMNRVTRKDPYIEHIYTYYESFRESWVEPRPSTHMYVLPLSPDLQPGLHTISVRAVDEHGREYTDNRIIQVE